MAQNGVYFNGKYYVHPGAYGVIDADNMTSMSSSSAKRLALIGTSLGGVPNQVNWFNDPTAAKSALKGGYLLKAAEKAWAPTNEADGGGAYAIACVRANKATQSSLDISDDVPVIASIGAAVKANDNKATGTLTSSGDYTKNTDETLVVVIDSEGTKALADATFSYKYASSETWAATAVALTGYETASPVVNGINLLFRTGNFTKGDRWEIKCIAAKSSTVGGKLVSDDYGIWTRKIQVKMENGTAKNTKKLTTFYWESDTYEIIDNIGAAFYLKYKGTQPYATLSILKNNEGKAVRLQTKVGADEGSAQMDLDIDLTESRFDKVRNLADYIAGYASDYSCRCFPVVSTGISSQDLDGMSVVDIKTEVLTTAIWADLEISLQTKSATVSLKRTATTTVGAPKNFAYTSLAGGVDGDTPSSWVDLFALLKPYDINYIVPLTGDESIIAEAQAHVLYMSNQMGMERSLKCGGFTGESAEQAKSRAMYCNSDRVQVAYPGFYDNNEYGELELYPSFITAAALAGRQAYLADGESATLNYFNVKSLEFNLEPEVVNECITAGVAVFEYVTSKGFRLAKDITTYTKDARSLYVERSVRDLGDTLNKELRNLIETEIISKKGVTTNVEGVKSTVISFLQQKQRDSVIVAYRNVKVSYYNKVIYIEYEAAPVEPVNFALITGHFYTADEITV